ncbi:MAG: hypothetical protein ABR987_10365 [Terracidiphilus sp.]
MKTRRITEITLQSDEIFTIRRSEGSIRTLCTQCASASAMVTPQEAATLFRVGIRAICREVDAGRLHFQENASGLLLICLQSLQSSALLGSTNFTIQGNQSQINQPKENPS